MLPLRGDDRAMQDAGTAHSTIGQLGGDVAEEGIAVARLQRLSGAQDLIHLGIGKAQRPLHRLPHETARVILQ